MIPTSTDRHMMLVSSVRERMMPVSSVCERMMPVSSFDCSATSETLKIPFSTPKEIPLLILTVKWMNVKSNAPSVKYIGQMTILKNGENYVMFV